MKKEIAKMIPDAIEATKKFLLTNKKVQKEYDNYAASLGASLRTSDLIPTLTFYTDISRSSDGARRLTLLWAIAYCLKELPSHLNGDPDERLLLEKVISDVYGANVFTREVENVELQRLGEPNEERISYWSERIENASIALKLAMRNFEHTKS